MGNEYTSAEVAERLGISRKTLIAFLRRNPDVRPKKRFVANFLIWTEAEVERLIERRNNRRKPGPKAKQGE